MFVGGFSIYPLPITLTTAGLNKPYLLERYQHEDGFNRASTAKKGPLWNLHN